MTSKLIPQNPSEVMVIRQIVPNVITTCSVPFHRFGHIKIGGRGTIVRLQNGSLAVFSPVALTPEVKEHVQSMGEVRYIAALDAEHHIFLGPWHEAYPQAKVLGPESLPEKRAKQKNENVPFHTVFTGKDKHQQSVDAEFDKEFEYEFVHAHANKELVFNHKPTRTLIEADLLFNMPATEQFSKTNENPTSGFLTKLFSNFTTMSGSAMGHKRFLWWGVSSGDRKAFNESIARINKWDFDRMIPCHGDVIETGAKTEFQKVMQWHIDAALKST
ncbi:hypothetical protein K490DRAFT_44048 [Saccharata proteae CBS 121410]|uniref:DUF4336 domain-containing protein n=1 Tax=Saccharata proteae CBS 121410 TaxID=1314787 RepID=A0A9P4HTJ3_9PEZI|nr:hypothetical protein K490DRAFT_44048 [Saccharata proteae CBS 121410]